MLSRPHCESNSISLVHSLAQDCKICYTFIVSSTGPALELCSVGKGETIMSLTTKKALADSLKKLLTNRPLDKITVKDIVEDAGVNRQTFYYHFQDIYDLIRWIFESQSEGAFSNAKTRKELQEEFVRLMEAMVEQRPLVMNAFRSISREALIQYIYQQVRPIILQRMEQEGGDLAVTDGDKQFVADFYQFAFAGLITEWIRSGMREAPEGVVDRLLRLMDGSFRQSLEKFASPSY